jgi:hypothetical protein
MKILNNEQVLKTFQHESNFKAQPPAGTAFGAILKETVENTTTAALAPMQTTHINPLAGLQPAASSPSDHRFTANSVEGIINLLDRYREKLADPRVTLKQIDPVIREMTREMENLAPVLDSLPADDKLSNILNETLVNVSLEISKFYRGDYISA